MKDTVTETVTSNISQKENSRLGGKIDLILSTTLVLLVSIPVSLTSLITAIIPLRYRSPLIRPVFKFWGWSLLKILNVKLTVLGSENLPADYEKGYLVISNHQSLLDIPVIASVTRLPFLMKKEITKVPVIGIGAVFYGCIPFDRSSLSARKTAGLRIIKQIERDVSTVTFPEGTRSKDGIPKEKIHSGLIKSAYLKKIPVIPLVIENTHLILDYSKKPFRIRKPVQVKLKILPVVKAEGHESPESFINASWSKIRTQALGE